MQLTINQQRDGDHVLLSVVGEVDIATAPTLRQTLMDATGDGARVITVDLTEVGFMDSTGLGVLVGSLKRLRQQDGNLIVVSPTDGPVHKIFEVTGLLDVFGVVETVDEAPGRS